MRRAAEVLRVLLISPEIAVVAIVGFAATRWPGAFDSLGKVIRPERIDAPALAVLAAPATLAVVAYKLTDEILRPSDSDRQLLAGWPDYFKLKVAALAGVAFAATGEIAWVVGLLLLQLEQGVAGPAIAIAGLAASLMALTTLALARIQVRDILDRAGQTCAD